MSTIQPKIVSYFWPYPYLVKVTKFLVKISQFEFLVMTEKNIFVYKLFLSLNISDFILFYFIFPLSFLMFLRGIEKQYGTVMG